MRDYKDGIVVVCILNDVWQSLRFGRWYLPSFPPFDVVKIVIQFKTVSRVASPQSLPDGRRGFEKRLGQEKQINPGEDSQHLENEILVHFVVVDLLNFERDRKEMQQAAACQSADGHAYQKHHGETIDAWMKQRQNNGATQRTQRRQSHENDAEGDARTEVDADVDARIGGVTDIFDGGKQSPRYGSI